VAADRYVSAPRKAPSSSSGRRRSQRWSSARRFCHTD
jgi:hypothetical protein